MNKLRYGQKHLKTIMEIVSPHGHLSLKMKRKLNYIKKHVVKVVTCKLERCKYIIAAQILYTIKRWSDRIAGFTPIPAMSMISYASARFINLLGGEMLSFMIGMLIYHLHLLGVNKPMYLNRDWYNAFTSLWALTFHLLVRLMPIL